MCVCPCICLSYIFHVLCYVFVTDLSLLLVATFYDFICNQFAWFVIPLMIISIYDCYYHSLLHYLTLCSSSLTFMINIYSILFILLLRLYSLLSFTPHFQSFLIRRIFSLYTKYSYSRCFDLLCLFVVLYLYLCLYLCRWMCVCVYVCVLLCMYWFESFVAIYLQSVKKASLTWLWWSLPLLPS